MMSILGWDWKMLKLRGGGLNCNVGFEWVGFDGGCVSGSLIEREESAISHLPFPFSDLYHPS